MDTLCHFFSRLFEPVEKHVQLPPGINTKPEIILEILHNHNFLVQNLFPSFAIKYIKYAPATTIFVLEKSTESITIRKKVAFSSFDDGVFVLQELEVAEASYRTSWTVTKTTTTPEQYFLRETFTASGDEISNIFYRFGDGYHRSTQYLVHFLGQIATGKASMSDVKRVQVNSSERKCVDTAKLKSD